ncbi:uncharacterized protein LOC133885461 [Phragmites australis]|uniref:uncharacterized protein LOC133885461 n=1 Tax=Phragmites australis TaxID=29695 RepID=UPI002D7A2E04|nr:uncharacterized protein LOC133885461 [Phragmites australis]
MAATEALALQGVGDVDDDEASFFELELALTGHLSAGINDGEDEKGKENDAKGMELEYTIDGEELVPTVEAGHRGDAASEALRQLGTAARFRALVRKLRKPKAARAGHPAGGGAALAPEANRCLVKASAQAARQSSVGAVAAEERQAPKEAARKYLGKIATLARRSVGRDRPDPSPPFHPQTTVLPARNSRCETELRQACERLGISVAATPPPQWERRDDSLLQAQDCIASAIAHCKRSIACYDCVPSGPSTQ